MEHLARVLRFCGHYLLSLVGMERGQRDRQLSGGEGADGTSETEMPADIEDQETNDTVGGEETPKIPIRGRKKNKKLKTKITDKNDEIERLKSQLQEAERQLHNEEERNNALQAEVTNLKEGQVARTRKDQDREIDKLNSEIGKLNRKIDKLKKKTNEKEKREIDKLNREIENLNSEIDKLNSEIDKLNSEIDKLNRKIDKLKTETNEKEKRQEKFKEYARKMECELKQKEADRVRLKEELTEEKKKHDSEKKDLLLRLSKVTGGNLTLDNPNIANLSDKNRPTKLAEEFSELYDNEWTDTFEVLKTDKNNRTAFMLHLLQRASTICQQISNNHMQSIKDSLCSLTLRTQLPKKIDVGTNEMFGILKNEKNQVFRNEVITMPFDSLQTDQRKVVTDLRKFVEKQLSNQLEMEVANVIASENDINLEGEDTVIKYIKKCVNICWTMCQHEPPVHVDFPDLQVNHKFDTNVFKPYTKSGKYLHSIVWPALYLYKDGPMLCKGVAQGNN